MNSDDLAECFRILGFCLLINAEPKLVGCTCVYIYLVRRTMDGAAKCDVVEV